jgi:hypothetical protein
MFDWYKMPAQIRSNNKYVIFNLYLYLSLGTLDFHSVFFKISGPYSAIW